MRGKITFAGNPWPAGHRLDELLFGARLHPGDELRQAGCYLDLHLVSAKYDADGPGIPESEASDWAAPVVWTNYHRFTISSTEWHSGGVLVGTDESPFDLAAVSDLLLQTDPLEAADAEADFSHRAFHVYLLGHDAVAGHSIHIKQGAPSSGLSISWTGRIALAYAGSYDFDHSFTASAEDVAFAGIDIPPELDDSRALGLLHRFVRDSRRFSLVSTDGRRRFSPVSGGAHG